MTKNSGKDSSPKIKVTQTALEIAMHARDQEIGSESHGLWMELADTQNGKREFSMYFRPVEDAQPDDFVRHHDGIAIVLPALSVERLAGGPAVFVTSVLVEKGLGLADDDDDDYEALDLMPSSPAIPAAPQTEVGRLSGSVAQRVVQTLNQQINPSIAVHGGRADLVAVEGDTAYLRLSGGCQGCGLATVTLSQGIEVAMKSAVPEIQHVVDVTDHSAGQNPYFESSKK